MGTEIALIFGSRACADWGFLEPLRNRVQVICADGGTRCAAAAGFPVNAYIGDSDSGGVPPEGAERVLLPAEKDLTDLQAAYEYARDRGIRRMIFTACTGGRQDHHIANLQLLEQAWRDGVDAAIWDEDNEIRYLQDGTVEIPHGQFRYFSLLPLDRTLSGVTIRGAKYNVENFSVLRGDTRTVSNETVGHPATVTVSQGAAWIIRAGRLV